MAEKKKRAQKNNRGREIDNESAIYFTPREREITINTMVTRFVGTCSEFKASFRAIFPPRSLPLDPYEFRKFEKFEFAHTPFEKV